MAVLQVRVDDELKNQAAEILDAVGIDLSTAVRMFLRKVILERGIPFDTRIDEVTLRARTTPTDIFPAAHTVRSRTKPT